MGSTSRVWYMWQIFYKIERLWLERCLSVIYPESSIFTTKYALLIDFLLEMSWKIETSNVIISDLWLCAYTKIKERGKKAVSKWLMLTIARRNYIRGPLIQDWELLETPL